MSASAVLGVVAFVVALLFLPINPWLVGIPSGLGAMALLEFLMKDKLKFPYLDSYENPGKR